MSVLSSQKEAEEHLVNGIHSPGTWLYNFLGSQSVLLSQLSGATDQDGAREFAKSQASSVSQLGESLLVRRTQILSAREDAYETVYREIVLKWAAIHK